MKKKTMDHAQLLVLTMLKREDMYGYQIVSELALRSEQIFEMKEGTLYPTLHAFCQDGLVECYEKEAPTGRTRKYYRITEKGKRELKTRTEEWKQYAHGIEAVLNFIPGERLIDTLDEMAREAWAGETGCGDEA